MKPTFHPYEELLMEYASGALGESHALMVATHLSFCPDCRATVRKMEGLGGEMLDSLTETRMSVSAKTALFDQLEDTPPEPLHPATTFACDSDSGFPPLWPYLPGGLSAARWRRLGPSVRYADLNKGRDGADAQLIHVKAGRKSIQHTHTGDEWTLVLKGAYDDGIGRYQAGDVVFADCDTDHNPTALPEEDCICLVVIDNPIRLTGPVGRLLDPIISRAFG
ncbi:MAG: ChrR family anti-sigma-E factor [Rhodospirillales bacterium]